MVDFFGLRKRVFSPSQDAMLREAFQKIKEEFEDHLSCINDSTSEINTNYEYLCEIDAKLRKMSERMDEIELLVKGNTPKQMPTPHLGTLTPREQEIFLVIYTFGGKEGGLTYKDISRKTALPEHMVVSYVTNLSMKGIPLIRNQGENGIYLDMPKEFRELQAKENVVKISESLIKKVQSYSPR